MPMRIPNTKSIPKSIENICKNGVDIDQVVRNSFSCAVKNSLSKFSKNTIECVTKLERKTKKHNTITPLKNKNFQIIVKPSSHKILKSEANKDREFIKKEIVENHAEQLDDSLTSLQWLTGVKVNDILEGKPITYAPLSPAPSTSSDDGDDKKSIRRETRFYSDSSIDYRTNRHVKPPYSYAALIIMAMKSRSCAKMTLSEIYKWITDNFVFYKYAEPSWQNSIRHNLSLNKCFAKIPRNKGDPGKGGYWRIVPEFANKLLESNIRKRRSSMMDYGCQDIIKRQCLDMFESQLLCRIKAEIKVENDDSYLKDNPEYKRSDQNTPVEVLADLEQCRIDHPYGKNPFAKYCGSDEENIKAIADNLERSTSNLYQSTSTTELSTSQVFNTFSSVIRTDCIWSSQQNMNDNLTESMSKVTEELLEARNLSTTSNSPLLGVRVLGNSLNMSGGLPFCLSPPLSGDDDGYSDDIDEFDEHPPVFSNDVNLTVCGTSITLLEPTPEMIAAQEYEIQIKEEPLSPESIDFEE